MPRNRLAPLVPLSFVCLLAACASAPQSPDAVVSQDSSNTSRTFQTASLHGLGGAGNGSAPMETEGAQQRPVFPHTQSPHQLDWEREVGPRQALPNLADQILNRATQLVGTPYRRGGSTLAGFDCSGFVNYVFRERAGMTLPRSTREIIDLEVPVVRTWPCGWDIRLSYELTCPDTGKVWATSGGPSFVRPELGRLPVGQFSRRGEGRIHLVDMRQEQILGVFVTPTAQRSMADSTKWCWRPLGRLQVVPIPKQDANGKAAS